MLININERKNEKQVNGDIVLNRLPRKVPLIKEFPEFLRESPKFWGFSPMNLVERAAWGARELANVTGESSSGGLAM
jgi:hypothetical protein